MTKIKRSDWLDNLKGFLIICVVVGHFIESGIDYNSGTSKALFVFIYSFHMPLFIFVSGMLCKHSLENKERLWEKIMTFLGLFVILKVLIYPFHRLNNPELKFSLVTTDDVPWYLFAMCVFYIVAYALREMDKRKILVVAIGLALLAGYDNGIGDVFVLSRCIVFFPCFVLGWMCEPEKVEMLLHHRCMKILSPVLLFTFFMICKYNIEDVYIFRRFFTGRSPYEALLNEQEEIGIVFRILAYMITFVMSVCVLSMIPRKSYFHFQTIGQKSLQIYFLHRPILYTLEYLNAYSYLYHHFHGIANYVWLVISVLFVIVLAHPVFSLPFITYQSFIRKKCIKKI